MPDGPSLSDINRRIEMVQEALRGVGVNVTRYGWNKNRKTGEVTFQFHATMEGEP